MSSIYYLATIYLMALSILFSLFGTNARTRMIGVVGIGFGTAELLTLLGVIA